MRSILFFCVLAVVFYAVIAEEKESRSKLTDKFESALREASKQWGLEYEELDKESKVVFDKLLKIARQQASNTSSKNVMEAIKKAGAVGARFLREERERKLKTAE